jgi:hypothetical protein
MRIFLHVKVTSVKVLEKDKVREDLLVPMVLYVQNSHTEWFEGVRTELIPDIVSLLGECWDDIKELHNNPPANPRRLNAAYKMAQLFCSTVVSPKYDVVDIEHASNALPKRVCHFSVKLYVYPKDSVVDFAIQEHRWR